MEVGGLAGVALGWTLPEGCWMPPQICKPWNLVSKTLVSQKNEESIMYPIKETYFF
jgi:hypothetical protein